MAAKLGSGLGSHGTTSKGIAYRKGSDMYSVQKVERAMELLSARNQRHKRAVRIQVTVSDLNGRGGGAGEKKNGRSWGLGDEPVDNPVARAMLKDYCCGFNLKEQERFQGKV